jgi:hypothetical protein
MSRMWRVQRRAFADEQRRRDHWHERLRLACHESGHAIANLAHWRRKNSIDGPPPDGNPNLARYCTGRTAHIGVWARLVCSLAGEAALGRMANGRRTGSMHGLSRTTLIVTT